jgi:hypothetical protein
MASTTTAASGTPQPEASAPQPRRPFLPTWSELTSERPRHQLKFFFAGAAFLLLSSAITRRSLLRRRRELAPAFYQANSDRGPLRRALLQLQQQKQQKQPGLGQSGQEQLPQQHGPLSSAYTSGAKDALEALTISTVSVMSVTLMLVGGCAWAFDIASLPELRERLRAGIGLDEPAQDANEEIEEWVASVLARKENKEKQQERQRRRSRGKRRRDEADVEDDDDDDDNDDE